MKNDTIAKLDQVAAKIEKDGAIKAAEKRIEMEKKEKLLFPPPPAVATDGPADGFMPSPILVKVAGGVTFHLMRKVTNIFERDLRPLTEQQTAQLETVLTKLAEKYLPAAVNKYQESGEIFLVLGGIVITNLTDLKKPGATDRVPAAQKPPEIPRTPEAHVTVITAEAPPVPEGVK